jgi:hypothetical protein
MTADTPSTLHIAWRDNGGLATVPMFVQPGMGEEWVRRAELDRLREALTPSGDTKAAYMGEIKDPETKRMVSWTAIKMVMAMIAKRAALATATPGDGGEG